MREVVFVYLFACYSYKDMMW